MHAKYNTTTALLKQTASLIQQSAEYPLVDLPARSTAANRETVWGGDIPESMAVNSGLRRYMGVKLLGIGVSRVFAQ